MATIPSKAETHQSQKPEKCSVFIQVLLRSVAFGTSLAASVVMATNKQRFDYLGIIHEVADYKASPCFGLLVGGTTVASLYSLISVFVFCLNSKSSKSGSSFFTYLFDLMMMGLVIASTSAATAVAYVGKEGNTVAAWSPICGHVPKFCNKVEISLLFSYASFITFFLILVLCK